MWFSSIVSFLPQRERTEARIWEIDRIYCLVIAGRPRNKV